MKGVMVSVCLFFLSGCAMTDYVGAGLQALDGKKVDVAFKVLGYPDRTQEFDGTTVYTWINTLNTVRAYAVSRPSYGKVGREYFEMTMIENQYVPVTLSCKIQIAVDKNREIRHHSYEDNGGCDTWSRQLKDYLAQRGGSG